MTNEYLDHISEGTLLDGGLVSLRRLDLDDLDGIISLSETLTESERYLRFFTAHPGYLKSWARSLADRSSRQFALGAFESGRGLGTVLLGRLGQIARDNGLDHLVADVLTENYLMRKVMPDAAWPCTVHTDGSELRVDVNLAELGQSMTLPSQIQSHQGA